MQKFDTPAPITAVLDIPAGRIRFIAADRTDTTVEVLPGERVEGPRCEGGGAGHRRIRRRCLADRRSGGQEPVLRPLRVHRGDGRAARRLEHRGEGVLRRVPGRRTSRRRHLRGVRRGQDRRGHERARGRLRRRRHRRPPHRPRGDQHPKGKHPHRRGHLRHGRAAHPDGRRDGRRHPRSFRLPRRRHPLRPNSQRAEEHRRRRRRPEHPRDHRPTATSSPAASEEHPS